MKKKKRTENERKSENEKTSCEQIMHNSWQITYYNYDLPLI